jgi:hypothetical protein
MEEKIVEKTNKEKLTKGIKNNRLRPNKGRRVYGRKARLRTA